MASNQAPDFIPDEQMASMAPQAVSPPPASALPNQPQPSQEPAVAKPVTPSATAQGTAPDFIPDSEFQADDDKYGTSSQLIKTAAEGAARGVAGPFATKAETMLGVDPQDILNRKNTNPLTSTAGEIAGLAIPALLTGGTSAGAEGAAGLAAKAAQFTQAGALEKITAKLGLVAGDTLASKVGTAAAKGIIDNALIAGSDEISKKILNDPNQTAGSVAANIGLSGLMGGVLGGGFGALSAGTGKLGQTISDFRGRVAEHIDNPDPVATMSKELQDHYTNMTSMADEVYGAKGLKAQDIEAALPDQMSPKMIDQVGDISAKLDNVQTKLADDPNGNLLEDQIKKYKQAVNTNDPEQVFNATQDLKQQMQEWAKYNKDLSPLSERPFRNAAKDVSFELRNALEDNSVWGKAADRQAAINDAFKEYLPALKDFQSKFMTKVGGEFTVDPGKVSTYLNGLDKPRMELRQDMLSNFIDASQKYKNVIADTHENLGMEQPELDSPLNVTMNSLGKKTSGARMADLFIDKALTDAGSKALAGAAGAGIGHAVGIGGEIGAIIGATALGPFFKSVLPALAKNFIAKPARAIAASEAMTFATLAAKAQMAMTKATAQVFKSSGEVLPQQAVGFVVSTNDIKKLDKQLKEFQENPMGVMNSSDNHLQHYMPDHAAATAQMTSQAVSYLNSLRPDRTPPGPLDKPPVPSNAAKARYTNALTIAEKPMLVLDKIKAGTVTQNDIQDLSTMYPGLYQDLKQKLFTQMTDSVSKGQTVPYKTRIGLSLFMAQPLDSTMTPIALQSAQMVLQGVQSAPPGASSPAHGKPSGGSKSAPALQKMPDMYATPDQARAARKNK